MVHSFEEIEQELISAFKPARIVLAGAEDEIALEAVIRARKAGIVSATLVGNQEAIESLLRERGENPGDYQVVEASSEMQAARKAIGLVTSGEADFPMKGRMQTASYLMAVRFGGLLPENSLVNEYTLFSFTDQNRMVLFGDSAVNIKPTLEEKKLICANLINVARMLGFGQIKVAGLSIVEKPSPDIQSSMDCVELKNIDWGSDVVFDGPLALDNILDKEAALHKGIDSPVAGEANVIIVPDAQAGNVLHKCAHFFGHYSFASGLAGSTKPVVMNSRTDDVDAKYHSILMAALQVASQTGVNAGAVSDAKDGE